MTWTVACYCGNIYSAPPDRCTVCGCTLEPTASNDTSSDGSRQPVDLRNVDVDTLPTATTRAAALGVPRV